MKKRSLVAVLITLASVICATQAVSALPRVSFKQRITELSCVLTTIVREDGSFSHILLPNCGTLVVPDGLAKQPLLYQPSFSQFALPPEGEAAKLFLRTKPVYLESDPQKQPLGGYVILMYPNIKYSFRLMGEADLLRDRTFEIVRSGKDYVTIRFLPEGKEVSVRLGDTVRFQLAYDNTPDVYLTLIQKNTDGSLVLRVRFPEQAELLRRAEDRRNSFVATSLLMSFGVAGFILFLQNSILKRKGLPTTEWWNTHSHKRI